MMKSLNKVLMLALVCLLIFAAAAQAAETTLTVDLRGLRGISGGSWQSETLTGSFTVLQDGKEIGVLSNTGSGWNVLKLSTANQVTLLPDMTSITPGFQVNASGYSVSLAQGHANTAPVMVYADAGLFEVQAWGQAEFLILDQQGDEALRFATDDEGKYSLPAAISAGNYVLTCANADMEEVGFTLPVYRGMPSQIVKLTVDMKPTEAPTPVPTAEPTAVPTAEPTVVPTAVPTEIPTEVPTAEPTAVPTEAPTVAPTPEPTAVPTEEPTAEPTQAPTAAPTEVPTNVPTEAPTAAPTDVPTPKPTQEPTPIPTELPTPVPTDGELVVNVIGTGSAAYELWDEHLLDAGTIHAGEGVAWNDLIQGEYTFIMYPDDDVMISGFNVYQMNAFEQAQWQVLVTPMQTNYYQVELTLTASVSGKLDHCEGSLIQLKGDSYSYEAVVSSGAVELSGLYPDTYQVTLALPQGDFIGDGWTFDHGTAATSITLVAGQMALLPDLDRVISGAVSGKVTDGDGKALENQTIIVVNEQGNVAAETSTDAYGCYKIGQLPEGVYTVQASQIGSRSATTARAVIDGSGDVIGADITVSKPATLLVRSFVDANNNGTRGTYESFLPGIEVTILQLSGNELIPAAQGVTGDDGYATFETLAAGQYVIHTKLPEGYGYGVQGKEVRATHSIMTLSEEYEQVSDVIVLKEGDRISAGVGALPLCTVTGAAWSDANADGVWQEDEPMQSGVIVRLVGEKNGLEYETITDENGLYTIDRVRYGRYSLVFTLPEGKVFTRYSAVGESQRSIITTEGSLTGKDSIILEAGETLDKRYIGVMDSAKVTGFCFKDANYNGFYDEGEEPLPGVEMTLLRQVNGKQVAVTTSGEDGYFAFSGVRGSIFKLKALLPVGAAYTLVVDDPSGNQFAARPGRREQTISDIEVEDCGTYSVVVGAVYQGTISGVAYLDDDFSGTYDEGEDIVTGLGVVLQDEAGNKIAEGRTSGRGRYTFENINPGRYRVVLNAKRGYAFTKLGEGNIILNTGDGAGQSEWITVEMGTNEQSMHLGMILPGTVKGEVFADANDNTLRDSHEGGLIGTRVSLMSEQGTEFTTEIGSDGQFVFDAVMPGRYYLRYELPEGGVFSAITSQGNTIHGENGAGAGDWFDFRVGQTVNAPLCGGLTLGAVNGAAYMDHNGNGIQDAGEPQLPGVEIILTPERADLMVMEALTDEDGCFSFVGLRPDEWQLTVRYPEVCVSSRMHQVTLPLQHGMHEQTVHLSVPMGARWDNQQLGGVIPASLAGIAWLDENNDGYRDGTEAASAGKTITILDDADGSVFATLTTDEYGMFQTQGLVPGRYTIAYQMADNNAVPQFGDTTFDYDAGMMVMRGVEAAAGDHVDGMVLGMVELSTLGGQVWVDKGSEIKPLSGANLVLMNAEGGELSAVTTGEDGKYAFSGLLPGSYLIGVEVPEGQVAVEPDDLRLTQGDLRSIMQECSGQKAVSAAIDVRMGVDQLELDVGSVLPGRIGDLCWLDLNGNGLQDTVESGIPHVRIDLMRHGQVIASTESDQYGYYVFEDLYPAVYTIKAVWPDEVKPTQQRTDFPAIASVLGADGISVEVSVESDQRNYNCDLGFTLVRKDKYPAGYGEGAIQDWTRIGW